MALFKTLRRLRRDGLYAPDPLHLERLTGLPRETTTAALPWLRSFDYKGRHALFTEPPATSADKRLLDSLSWHVRRPLAHAVRFGRWPAIRDVFTPPTLALAEAMLRASPRRASDLVRDRAFAACIAECAHRFDLGATLEVLADAVPELCSAAVTLTHEALFDPAVTARLLVRLATIPIGGDLRADAVDGLRIAGLVTPEVERALHRCLFVSSGRLRVATATALKGPRAEFVLAWAITDRRASADIPVRAAAALVTIAPEHPLVPDALELLYLGLAYPSLDRLVMDALGLSRRLDVAERLEALSLASPLARTSRVDHAELAATARAIRARCG